jgi:hypothetical protein
MSGLSAPLPTADDAALARGRQLLLVGGVFLLLALAGVALTASPSAAGVAPLSPLSGVAVAPAMVLPPAGGGTVPRSADRLLGEAEYVNGPLAVGFDIAGFLAGRGGALSTYEETVSGERLSAAQIFRRVADEHSLSPRLLIALVDDGSGALDDPAAGPRLAQPLGETMPGGGLHAALRAAAAWLDDGFYGLKYRGTTTVSFGDGTTREGPTDAGAAHFAVARFLAMGVRPEDWAARRERFAERYRALFGDIPAGAEGALPPPGPQPPLLLPWAEGERWYNTGGPHGAWGIATAWGAVDFAPPSLVGCDAAPEWVLAAAPGVVTRSERGYVVVDLDGDGAEGTGWVLLYLHMATDGRLPAGSRVAAGDRIGHPSCEGGRATGAHLHLARKLNGQWLPAAGGPAPLDLSGWTFQGGSREYDGGMQHAGEEDRTAVTAGRGGRSDITSDNGPARRAALAGAWQALASGVLAAAPAPTVAIAAATAADVPGLAAQSAQSAQSAHSAQSALAAPATAAPAPDAAAPTGADIGTGELVILVRLPGTRSQATPLTVEVRGTAGEGVPLMGHTGQDGASAPIPLPALPSGPYVLTVRVPGFRPQQLFEVALGNGRTTVDLRSDLVPMVAGELTRDDAIDGGDALQWLQLAASGSSAADLDGDGGVGAGDIVRLVQAWTGGAR